MYPVSIIDGGDHGARWVFFVRGEKTAIVDAGFPGQERPILRALKACGISREDVSLIVITHGHVDHYGSAAMLKQMLKVPLVAGWPDADHMSRGESAPTEPYGPDQATGMAGVTCPPVAVDIVVRADMSLKPYGIDGDILLTPGHTEGSLSIAAGDGCVIGDLTLAYCSGGRPVTPMNPKTFYHIRKSIEKVTSGDWKWIYPAHDSRHGTEEIREQCL